VYKIVQNLLQPVENLESSNTKNFLLQHSTGSGKSLTIACLTYCLYLLRVTHLPRLIFAPWTVHLYLPLSLIYS
jgi:type I site-specific restriction-modification system R (restriction) subunit